MKKVPCYIYSRICGYFQPLQNWHKGKQEEFAQRKEISVKKALESKKIFDKCE